MLVTTHIGGLLASFTCKDFDGNNQTIIQYCRFREHLFKNCAEYRKYLNLDNMKEFLDFRVKVIQACGLVCHKRFGMVFWNYLNMTMTDDIIYSLLGVLNDIFILDYVHSGFSFLNIRHYKSLVYDLAQSIPKEAFSLPTVTLHENLFEKIKKYISPSDSHNSSECEEYVEDFVEDDIKYLMEYRKYFVEYLKLYKLPLEKQIDKVEETLNIPLIRAELNQLNEKYQSFEILLKRSLHILTKKELDSFDIEYTNSYFIYNDRNYITPINSDSECQLPFTLNYDDKIFNSYGEKTAIAVTLFISMTLIAIHLLLMTYAYSQRDYIKKTFGSDNVSSQVSTPSTNDISLESLSSSVS
ncbi:hypothetical protein GJ496_006249 [Pomphorhynchus laevis]|nr:hypothetical protein GJ496_006249 [Pomphorhynchus laevis]